MTILFVNFLAYALWFVCALKKRKWKFDVYCLTLSFFVVVSFLGFYTYATGIYQNTFGNIDLKSFSAVPYFFALICVFLFALPVRFRMDRLSIVPVKKYVPFFTKVSFVLFAVFVVHAGFSLVNVDIAALDYADAYNDAASGSVSTFKNPITNFVNSKIIMMARLGLPFFYTIQCLLIAVTKKNKHIVMIVIAYFLLLIPQIVTANRGGMFFSTANLLFFIVMFWPHFPAKNKRSIAFLMIGAFVVMSSFAIAISNARFENAKTTSGTEQILRYFGEPYPNLGFNIWGKKINHPYGLRMFPNYIGNLVGENVSQNIKGGRNAGFYYWERFVGVPMLNFKTLFGDLYIEYNFIGTWCITILWVLLLRFLKKNKGIFGSIIFTFFGYQTCVWGLFGANFSEQYLITILYMIILLWLWKKTNFGKIQREDKRLII